MVLARLLTPSEVGAYAVAMVLLSLAATVRDLGVGQYLVLEKDLTTDRIRAVWAVQLGFGTLLAAAIYFASGPLSIFFSEPEVGTILTVLAVSYLFNPLGSITYAWLIREMRFEAIAIMRFSSTLSGALVSVYLAWKGHGPVSMAWGGLVSTMVNAAVSIKFRPTDYPWLPGLREVRRVLSLGTKVTSTALLNTVHMGAPEFLLGKFQGLAAAGFFSRGNGLVAMFNRLITDAVQTVALSLFAKERRAGDASGASFATSIAYMTVLSYSFGLFLLLLAFPMVRFLYGTQWDDSVELTRVLCVGIAIGSPVPMCIAALMAADQASRVVRITAGMTTLSVLACAFAAQFGAIYVCLAIVCATAIGTVAWMRAAMQAIGSGGGAILKAMTQSAAVALCAAIGPAVVVWVFGWRPTEVLLVLGLGSTTCIVGFLVGVYGIKHPIAAEIERLRTRLPRLRISRSPGVLHQHSQRTPVAEAMPASPPARHNLVDIVVVSWNTRELTLDCLHSVQAEMAAFAVDAKIWVIDNDSADGTAEAVQQAFPNFTLICNEENVGFARANNQAIVLGTGAWVLLLNSDTLVPPGELKRLMDYAQENPIVGVVGPRLNYQNGAPQTSVDTITTPLTQMAFLASFYFPPFDNWFRKLFRKRRYGLVSGSDPRRVELLSAACLLVRRDVFEQVGLLPEQYFLFSEENDFFWRVKHAGIVCMFQPQIAIVHLLGGSRKPQSDRSNSDKLFLSGRLRFLLHRYPAQRELTIRSHRAFLYWCIGYSKLSDTLRRRPGGFVQWYQELAELVNREVEDSLRVTLR